jgi:hypothetical protein
MVDAFKEAAEQAKKDGRLRDYDIENGDGSVNQQVSQDEWLNPEACRRHGDQRCVSNSAERGHRESLRCRH